MDAEAGHFPADAGDRCVMPNHIPVDGSGIEGSLELFGRAVVSDWPEEWAGAVDAEMADPFPALEIPHAEAAELLAADPVVKEGGQNGAIADAFERVLGRRLEQAAGLAVAERRRCPLPRMTHPALRSQR
jgi:hypothetical protein